MLVIFSVAGVFLMQSCVAALILNPSGSTHRIPPSSLARHSAGCHLLRAKDLSIADVSSHVDIPSHPDEQCIDYESLELLANRQEQCDPPPKRIKSLTRVESHLKPGPILLSWAAGATTLIAQVHFTDWAQLGHDAEQLWAYLASGSLLDTAIDPVAQLLVLYGFIYVNVIGSSFFVMPNVWPPQQSACGTPLQVKHRSRNMVQHELNRVDFSCVDLCGCCRACCWGLLLGSLARTRLPRLSLAFSPHAQLLSFSQIVDTWLSTRCACPAFSITSSAFYACGASIPSRRRWR